MLRRFLSDSTPLMMACHGVPCASAASQAMRTAAVNKDRRFDFGRPITCGTTPLAACGRGNCPRRERASIANMNLRHSRTSDRANSVHDRENALVLILGNRWVRPQNTRQTKAFIALPVAGLET
jgi:hypothetical protein